MTIKNTFVSLATVVFLLAGGLPLTAAGGQTLQASNIHDFDGFNLAGAATLTRTKQSATARISTTGLDQNAAYTIWWVVWNDPSQRLNGCGSDDLQIAAIRSFMPVDS